MKDRYFRNMCDKVVSDNSFKTVYILLPTAVDISVENGMPKIKNVRHGKAKDIQDILNKDKIFASFSAAWNRLFT